MMLRTHELDRSVAYSDPIVAANHALLDANPLRAPRTVVCFRSWDGRDDGQLSPVFNTRLFQLAARWTLTTRNVAFVFAVNRDPNQWRQMADSDPMQSIIAEVDVGGRPHAIIAHDFRVYDAVHWLEGNLRGLAGHTPDQPGVRQLDHDEFNQAVRMALKQMGKPGALEGNPLVFAACVLRAAGLTSSVQNRSVAIRRLLVDAVARAGRDGDGRVEPVLRHTYLTPGVKQFAVATDLGLSLATYRRVLDAGARRVVATLDVASSAPLADAAN